MEHETETTATVGHAEQKQGLPQLNPEWFASQIFWLLVSFVVLYVALSRLLMPRVQKALDIRRDTFDSALSEADRFRNEAAAAQETYEKTVAEARAKAQTQIAAAAKASEQQAALRLAELDAKLAKQLADGESRIHEARTRATQNIVPAATEMAEMVVSKLLATTADRASLSAAVDRIAKEK